MIMEYARTYAVSALANRVCLEEKVLDVRTGREKRLMEARCTESKVAVPSDTKLIKSAHPFVVTE